MNLGRDGGIPILLIFLCTLLLLSAAVPLLTHEAGAETEEYPGKHKVISHLDSYAGEETKYGNWTWEGSSNPTVYSANRSFGSPTIEGSAAQLSFQVNSGYNSLSYAQYQFLSNSSRHPLQYHTFNFYYRGNYSEYVKAAALGQALNDSGSTINTQYMSLELDDEWHLASFDSLYTEEAAQYRITVRLGTMHFFSSSGSTGAGNLSIDLNYALSPPCDVRFSFYNQYSGLGLNSEILIPEVYHDGEWTRVWDNEIIIAAGEEIGYRITDYFDRTIEVGWITLNDTVKYLDIPVPLVDVYISKPDFYNSTLPPEWELTYMPNGNSIEVTGWHIELLAGWYDFAWPDDGIRKNGSVEKNVQGNNTTGSAHTMMDFSLSMEPTYRGKGAVGDQVLPSLLDWQGFRDLIVAMYDSWEFKAISVLGIGIAFFFYAYRARKFAEEEDL